ncbi:MAG: hypothetical protein A2W91_18550 [Bacteroidetes bacterium GWF2_38_335]|nr:MAG: hypothetical protein A2W91_18550 [Bacteroidetes bacterium GWF2_38_335]OFY78195.1 MAG: hypothetical protein A2281_04515 [Bacteroidetes bacterium RIFOXYA12_FULL_38_20]HBS88642.1 RecX family transcriptional regulator [Bacteroidales bacterium]
MEKKPDKKIVLSKAKNLCSRKEKCKSEIFESLMKWGVEKDMAEEVIADLEKEKYIDEARYAEFFTTDSYKLKHWGRVKIEYHLRMKKIPSALIHNAFDEIIDEGEYEKILSKLLKDKMRSVKGINTYAGKAKIIRFAQSRGFETELTLKILDELL